MQPRVTIVTATFNLIRAGRKDFFLNVFKALKIKPLKILSI